MMTEIANITVAYGAVEPADRSVHQQIQRLCRLGYINQTQQEFLNKKHTQIHIAESRQLHHLHVQIFLTDPDPRSITAARLIF
jgi:hypothetical protein